MSDLAELIGQSPALEVLRNSIRRLIIPGASSHRLPSVLIQGETGTGKGLVAKLLHRLGPRRGHDLIELNCSAIPDALLESELFGYEKGAFTDARRAKPGLFQLAHRGVIFLDEISLLPEMLQAKLLKVVEERSVRRLGAIHSEPVDTWIISASNVDLTAAIKTRQFREDLYHRLAVFTLTVPPLRARGADILLLAEHYLARACADYGLEPRVLTPDARARLMNYAWPGNVRELANTMERAALTSDKPWVTAALLNLADAPLRSISEPQRPSRVVSMEGSMAEHLQAVLDQTGGNISRSAALLGITRNTVRSRIRKLGLRVPRADHELHGGSPHAVTGGPRPDTLPAAERFIEPVAPSVPFVWERRIIAALATSLTTRPDTSVFQLTPILHDLIRKLKSFGARLEELTPTGLVAMFGFEPMENATSRAAQAALGMLREVERSDYCQRDGLRVTLAIYARRCLVARGSDITGMDSAERRTIFVALDQLVKGAVPNTIVVDHAAAQFLQRRFVLEPAAAPGGGPGDIQRLVGPGRTGFEVGGRSLSPFVGRELDMATLQRLLVQAQEGRGQVVTIVGEAGVGKSRLLHEFRQTLSSGQVTYLAGHCFPYASTVPYFPFIDIVRASFGLADSDTPATVDDKLRSGLEALDMDPTEWAAYLLHFIGHPAGTEALVHLSPDALRTRTRDALRRMALAGSLRRPMVFVIEDLQWIDRTSQDTLASLVEDVAASPILLIATHRPDHQPPWSGQAHVSRVLLRGLAKSESLAVVHSVASNEALPSDLVHTILSRAEGIPFFLEELARASAEHPDLRSEITLPETVQDVLAARLDRLPAEERELLQIASVIGKDLSAPILTSVASLPNAVLTERLDRLRRAEFIYERSSFPTLEYTFKHALTHEASYWSILESQRNALHARVVEAIESHYPDRLGEQMDALAYHAFRGKVWNKAVSYLRSAGDRALRSSANGEAAEFFERALTAVASLPESPSTLAQAVDIRLGLRDALWAVAKLDEMQDHLHSAEAVARRLGDRRREGWIACYLSQHAWSVVQLDNALEAGDRALEIARNLPDRALEAETGFYLGLVHLALGDASRAATLLSTALELLDKVASADSGQFSSRRFAANGPILVRGWMSRVLAELGSFGEAERWGWEAIRLGEEAQSPFALTTALAGLGCAYLRKGEPEHAIPPLERGLELCRRYKFNNWFPTMAACLGAAYVSGRRVASGVALLEESVSQGAERGIGSSSALWQVYLGEAYLHAGRIPEAWTVGERALQLCRDHKEWGYQAWALRLLGDIASNSATASADVAEARYREALTLAEPRGMRPLAARCWLGLGRLAERLGDRSAAEAHLAKAAAICRELDMPLLSDPALA